MSEMGLTNIIAALCKAQAAMGKALKDSENPHFRSKYADLESVVEAVRKPLSENGLAFMQIFHDCENGVGVETVLYHTSGEFLSGGVLRIPATKQDAQGYGSAITYARRYSLQTACGVAPEDDDGNAASKPQVAHKPAPKPIAEGKTKAEVVQAVAKALDATPVEGSSVGIVKSVVKAKVSGKDKFGITIGTDLLGTYDAGLAAQAETLSGQTVNYKYRPLTGGKLELISLTPTVPEVPEEITQIDVPWDREPGEEG